jgi:hypothetical protein
MSKNSECINVRGKQVAVPTLAVGPCKVVVTGRWLKLAKVKSEDWLEQEPVRDPAEFVAQIQHSQLTADIFTFTQRVDSPEPRFPYRFERDNVAAIPLTTYDDWWQKRLSRKTRQEVTRSQRLGVVVKAVPWGDALIAGIVDLFRRIPIKQGMPFDHYGKDYDTVKREVSSYVERSDFIGAYHGDQLIGYVKIVRLGKLASILNLITDEAHFDKRPNNALMAKAVEVCTQNGMQYLLYGKYTYGKKVNDSLAEFKRRNGFEEITVPRYYVPLNWRGRLALKCNLHLGLLAILPSGLISSLVKWRSIAYLRVLRPLQAWWTGRAIRPDHSSVASSQTAAEVTPDSPAGSASEKIPVPPSVSC